MLLRLTAFFLVIAALPAWSLGGQAPKPNYKLEVLKMEVIPASSDLSAKKVLLVIAPRDFHDQEFSQPKAILEAKGAKVTVASSKQTSTGMFGAKVKADILLKDAKAADYDAVVFIGGNGAEVYVNDPRALSLAIEAQKNDKIIGAICIAPMILAKAGVLEGKKATVSPYGKKSLVKSGAILSSKAVEIDGKIVTGSGPRSAEEFGQALLKLLENQ
jgi:protease I